MNSPALNPNVHSLDNREGLGHLLIYLPRKRKSTRQPESR
jgi:hypothetical protein